ncbi:ankyrin repeat-containing domain protein [Xylariales sp. PMI_506]|nr:ankyrin repeat-containing domain protein [Xylariales sp. PMI_506]
MFLDKPSYIEASYQALLAVKSQSYGPDYSQRAPKGATGLHLETYFDLRRAVYSLLDYPTVWQLEVADSYGFTPLHRAAGNGCKEIVELLLDKGAVLDVVNYCGLTPLHWAVSTGHTAIVKLLVYSGADLEVTDIYGFTSSNLAMVNDYHDIIKLLVDEGADLDVIEEDGETLLH